MIHLNFFPSDRSAAIRREALGRRALGSLGAVAAAALLVSACGGDDVKLRERTLTFTETDTDYFSFVDAAPRTKLTPDGPEQVSNGDEMTISNDLLDGSQRDVGDADVTCVVTRTPGEPERGVAAGSLDDANAVCTLVITVADGSLTASHGGQAFAEDATRWSIVGGTGEYAGASGEFVTASGERKTATAHLFLPER